jgi:hypothetical protein
MSVDQPDQPAATARRRPSKVATIAALLERRIRQGDYLVAPLPAERELAREVGVSYMTARKAVQQLQRQGLLARSSTGRLTLGEGAATRSPQIAFLTPAYPSADVMRWRQHLDRALPAGVALKGHLYAHWDDPALVDILERSDGVFIYPSPEPLPAALTARLRAGCRAVVVDQDRSHLGLPSIRLYPPEHVGALLKPLRAAGHRRIDCFNVQPTDEAIAERVAAWRGWCERSGVAGELIDTPVRPGEESLVQAHRVMAGRLAQARGDLAPLFCTTIFAALGALRAAHERGLRPGVDLRVCTLNDEGLGAFTVPSITALAAVDPVPWLKRAVAWMCAPSEPWSGPLLMEPGTVVVNERESTRSE